MSVKISQLGTASSLIGIEQIPIVQDGTTKKVSVSDLGFPFAGDAKIEGTLSIEGALNIDFTETLNFYSGSELEIEIVQSAGGSYVETVLTGNSIGSKVLMGEDSVTSAIIDGAFSIPSFGASGSAVLSGDFIEIEEDELMGSRLFSIIGINDESSIGNPKRYYIESGAFLQNNGVNRQYNFGVNINEFAENLRISKSNEDNKETGINLNDFTNSVNIFSNQTDPDDEILQVVDTDEFNILFIIKKRGVFLPNLPISDPLISGQLWNNNGVLSISAG